MYRVCDNTRLGGAARLNKVDSLWSLVLLLFTSLHNYLHGSLNIMHARLAFCRENHGKLDVFITKLSRNDSKNIIYFLYKCAWEDPPIWRHLFENVKLFKKIYINSQLTYKNTIASMKVII